MDFINFIEDLQNSAAKYGSRNSASKVMPDAFVRPEEMKQNINGMAHSAMSAYQKAEKETLDAWIDKGFFGPLIDFAIDNFDDGSGDDFIQTLSDALVKEKQLYKIERLWKGVISLRRTRTVLAESRANARAFTGNSNSFNKAKEQTLSSMARFAQALESVGNSSAATQVKTARKTFNHCELGEHGQSQWIWVLKDKQNNSKSSHQSQKMDELMFWQLIDDCRLASTGDESMALCLSQKLSSLSLSQIRKFQSLFLRQLKLSYLPDLRVVCYKICDDKSADLFDSFRSWLISRGKDYFEEALIKPPGAKEVKHDIEELSYERFADAAHNAMISKTGSPMKHATNLRLTLNIFAF